MSTIEFVGKNLVNCIDKRKKNGKSLGTTNMELYCSGLLLIPTFVQLAAFYLAGNVTD